MLAAPAWLLGPFLGWGLGEVLLRWVRFGWFAGVLVLGSVVCLGYWAFVLALVLWVGMGFGGLDEPESLILAQSERWRHA